MMGVRPEHDDDGDDAGVQDVNPLRGVVLCCTSLPQEIRAKVEEVVKPMGAVHKPDLTTDVTHLLVGKIDTPKYRYVAAERPDISVLHPSWIEAVREAWTSGGAVDVEALTNAHRLPALHELQICVTGFASQDERNLIMSHVQRNGAVYHGDLTRAVTHLVAAVPEGKKYHAAKAWGEVKIVSLKWLEDCLRRGMVVNEELYDPMLPAEKQGRNAFREFVARPSKSVKRARDAADNDDVDGAKRKLRRTVSSRLHDQSQDMWTDLSGMEVKKDEPRRDQWKDDTLEVVGRASVKPETRASETDDSAMIPLKGDSGHRGDDPANDARPAQAPDALFTGRHILLHGFDDERVARLLSFLEPNGAHIATTSRGLDDAPAADPFFQARYLLVPHALPLASNDTVDSAAKSSTIAPPSIHPLPDVPPGTQTVTEWWVERCIHSKRLLDPITDPLSRPFWLIPDVNSHGERNAHSPKVAATSTIPQSIRIEGFEAMNVSTTGFGGVEVRQIAGAVKLLGGSYLETLAKQTSVIVYGSSEDDGANTGTGIGTASAINQGKAFYAVRHGIPIVNPAWLWACLGKGRVVAFEPFKVKLPDVYSAASGGYAAASSGGDGGDDAAAESRHHANRKPRDESRKSGSSSHSKRLSSFGKKTSTSSLSLQASKPDTSFAPGEKASDRVQTESSVSKLSTAEARPEPSAIKSHTPTEIQSGPVTSKAKPSPFVHEDDDEDEDDPPAVNDDSLPAPGSLSQEMAPQRRSRPLAERSPNLSPRKRDNASEKNVAAVRQSSGDDNLEPNVAREDKSSSREIQQQQTSPRGATSTSFISPPPEDMTTHQTQSKPLASTLRNNASNLAADMRSLLDHATAASSRPTSARTASSADSSSSHNRQRAATAEAPSTSHLLARKKRPLGRNISGNGLSNLSTSMSLNAGIDTRQQVESTSTLAPPLPTTMLGTQISYASPDAELHRAEMGRKMGLKFSDDEGDDPDCGGGDGGPNAGADGGLGNNTNGTAGTDLQRETGSRLLVTQRPKSSGLKREKLQRLGRVKDSEVLSAAGSRSGAATGGGVASRVRARVGRGR